MNGPFWEVWVEDGWTTLDNLGSVVVLFVGVSLVGSSPSYFAGERRKCLKLVEGVSSIGVSLPLYWDVSKPEFILQGMAVVLRRHLPLFTHNQGESFPAGVALSSSD
ncbi:unnamed protein product [Cuscuta europaea]|uniref:Uncharacterized protein n=1 Tax=Cuscuta europaea TaxID=41803 RepID=A0A9P0YYC6_CUSEU|nr:unnamed protein product [Cuscuta europaea]